MEVSKSLGSHRPRHRATRFASTALLALSTCAAHAAQMPQPPAAVELTGALWGKQPKAARPVPIEAFDQSKNAGGARSAAILAKPEVPSSPGLSWEGIAEKKALAANKSQVSRRGKILAISIPDGGEVKFADWKMAESANADGDAVSYRYAGRLGGSGYHRVVAMWQHDSPSTYLINPKSGKAISVHPGDAPFIASADAAHVFAMEENAPNWGFALGTLSEQGPSVDLSCVVEGVAGGSLTPSFRGWQHEGLGFDIVFAVQRPDGGNMALPLRFSRAADGWHGYAPDPAAANKLMKFTCTQ